MSLKARGDTNPGRLDRRVVLQCPSESRDAAGGVVTDWINVATVWASKLPVSGGRMYAAEAKHFEVSLTYRIRHRFDIATGWRLVHGDDVFEVTALMEQGRRDYLDLELRGIDQTTGDSFDALQLESSSSVDFLLLESGLPVHLENAA